MRFFKIPMFLILLAVLTGCSDNTVIEEPTSTQVRSIDDFTWIGDLHNAFLDGVTDPGETGSTRTDAPQIDWEQIHVAQVNQAQALDISSVYKTAFVTSLDETQSFYQTPNLYAQIFPDNSLSSINSKHNLLLSSKVIDSYELSLIKELTEATKKNMDGVIDNFQLAIIVNNLCQKWNGHYGNTIQLVGIYSAHILAIAKSSMEWWSEEDYATRSASAIIGADVAGALASAAVSAISQYAAHKTVDGKVVAYSALEGAVTGSTGVVGRVGKLITRFLR